MISCSHSHGKHSGKRFRWPLNHAVRYQSAPKKRLSSPTSRTASSRSASSPSSQKRLHCKLTATGSQNVHLLGAFLEGLRPHQADERVPSLLLVPTSTHMRSRGYKSHTQEGKIL